MNRHLDSKHKFSFGNSFMYVKEKIKTSKYNLCNVDCGNLENLRKHMSLYHTNLCDDCGKIQLILT